MLIGVLIVWGKMKLGGSPLGVRELDLDVVRGLAILLAMGWHLAGEGTGIAVLDSIFWPARTFGWAGVDLFFVLSGFLVGRIVFQEIAQTGRFDSKRFLVRRIFKLWPVFYVFLLAQLVFRGNNWEAFLFQNAFHVQNYLGSSHSHLWSLAVEEHFYLALALVIPYLVSRGWQPRRLAFVLAAIMVVSLSLRFLGLILGSTPVELQTFTHFRIDGLACGVLLALLSVHYPAKFASLLTLRWLWAFVVAGGILWLTLVPKATSAGSTAGYTVAYLAAAAFMMLLYRAAWILRLSTVLRPVGVLGVYSYALYLWHVSAARMGETAIEALFPSLNSSVMQLAAGYAAAIFVAVILTRLIEWPVLKLRNRLFPNLPRVATSSRA